MKIKNWHKFQHFKDRNPIWIKLYRKLLDDIEWHMLPAPAAKLLVSLWIIAAEDKAQTGALPDTRILAFRLRMREEEITSLIKLLGHWVDADDINLISSGYQVDITEKRREETETEKEKETEILPASAGGVVDQPPAKKRNHAPKADTTLPADLSTWGIADLWAEWIGRKKLTQRGVDINLNKLRTWGRTKARAALEQTLANGWQGLFEPRNMEDAQQAPPLPQHVCTATKPKPSPRPEDMPIEEAVHWNGSRIAGYEGRHRETLTASCPPGLTADEAINTASLPIALGAAERPQPGQWHAYVLECIASKRKETSL